jgi:hypothetical protein
VKLALVPTHPLDQVVLNVKLCRVLMVLSLSVTTFQVRRMKEGEQFVS